MKVIYIAGRYRGPNAWAIEQNIRAAEDVAAKVWAMGHVALCPHANARHMLEGVCSDEHALAGTLELMRRCDAVVILDNWHKSVGARGEVAEAIRLGIPIIYAWDDETYLRSCLDMLQHSPRMDYDGANIDEDPSHWTLYPGCEGAR